jgi:hypothetical protein
VLNRGSIRRVENQARGFLESFELRNGERYYYSPTEAGISLFLFTCDGIRAPYTDDPPPEEPEFIEALRQAEDPAGVLARFRSGDGSGSFTDLDGILARVRAPREAPQEPAEPVEDLSEGQSSPQP